MALTLTAYAKLRGVSVKSVSRAAASGRLSASVGRNDRDQPTILDPDLADREWAANTRQRVDGQPIVVASDRRGTPDPDQSGGENSSKLTVSAGSNPAPDTPPRGRRAELPEGVPVYHVSQAVRAAAAARREIAAADQAELDLAARRGRLVDADQARADVEQAYSLVKTRLLRVPSDLAQRMPHLAAEVVPVLEPLLRQALEELSQGSRA